VRILILGDSLPFPRPHKGQPVDVTWPTLLKARFPGADLWLRASPRSCILDVIKELFFFTDSLPDFDAIIVQTGIVDCAPRPYPRWVYKSLETFLGMAKLRKIERFAHDHLLWLHGRPWVNERSFASSLRRIVETAHERNPRLVALFIPIAPPTRTIVQTLPGIDHAAAIYNQAMERETSGLAAEYSCQCLQPFADRDPLEITIEDGHHLSVTGHRLIAESLASALQTLIPSLNPAALAASPVETVSLSASASWPKKSTRAKDRPHLTR